MTPIDVAQLAECRLCPRLVQYRQSVKPPPRYAGWTYWNKPVPPWGDPQARLVIVGLAPAAHGGNRTGRMFTGDKSAQNLFQVLYQLGLSSSPYSLSKDDGTRLRCVYVTSAVKCAPPRNRPTAEEVANCNKWLRQELAALRPKSVVALGRVAWDAVLMAYGLKKQPFAHGAWVRVGETRIYASYHPSPLNVNSGRLTAAQLKEVILSAAEYAGCVE